MRTMWREALHNRHRLRAAQDAPWADLLFGAQNTPLLVYEGNVYRRAHEERVHAPARHDEEHAVLSQPGAPPANKTSHTAPKAARNAHATLALAPAEARVVALAEIIAAGLVHVRTHPLAALVRVRAHVLAFAYVRALARTHTLVRILSFSPAFKLVCTYSKRPGV